MATGAGGLSRGRSRRARGEGSIVAYRGAWRVRIRWRGTEGTWFAPSHAQAVVLLRRKLRERDEPAAYTAPQLAGVPPRKGTLDAWLDEWLSQVALARPRTYPFYCQKAALIRPGLGRLALATLSAGDIRHALAALAAEGRSPTMLSHVYRTLSTALNAAQKERQIVHNPCRDVATPHRSEFEAPTLTVEQSQRLVSVAWDTRLGPLIVLALSTGMRAGELLALTWDDIGLQDGRVVVSKTVHWQPSGRHVAGSPKTRASRRTVRIGSLAISALEAQHQRVLRMRLQASVWEDRNLVFPTPRGTYMIPSGGFVREFRSLLNRAECPRIRWHDLRHTSGLLLTRSVGVVVASRILGHSSPTITASLYGHAQAEDYTYAAEAMGRLLTPAPADVIGGAP
jgi:integrase